VKATWETRGADLPRLAGAAALFSGAALVMHIVAGVSLRAALLSAGGGVGAAVGWRWWRATRCERVAVARKAKVGLMAGLVATVAYDAAKFALSQWEASPYNPFEVLPAFGALLVGASAAPPLIYLAGTAYHLWNGIAFGVAFCLIFRRARVAAGIGWGLFLELFQLTLYPGWLDIRFYREFVQISFIAHTVYGVVLGAACQYGLGRRRAERVWPWLARS